MKWFEFNQNNSGGHFDAHLGYYLWVQAMDASHANALAQDVGVYFDGCDSGIDCRCCGDRWNEAWGDGEAAPKDNEYA